MQATYVQKPGSRHFITRVVWISVQGSNTRPLPVEGLIQLDVGLEVDNPTLNL